MLLSQYSSYETSLPFVPLPYSFSFTSFYIYWLYPSSSFFNSSIFFAFFPLLTSLPLYFFFLLPCLNLCTSFFHAFLLLLHSVISLLPRTFFVFCLYPSSLFVSFFLALVIIPYHYSRLPFSFHSTLLLTFLLELFLLLFFTVLFLLPCPYPSPLLLPFLPPFFSSVYV